MRMAAGHSWALRAPGCGAETSSRYSPYCNVHRGRLRRQGAVDQQREIGRRLGVARSTIQDNLKRAAAAGLKWPLADDVTEEALELQLFGRAAIATGLRRFCGRKKVSGHVYTGPK